MSKTPPDKNEIVTRRAPRWAWQAVDMLMASEAKAAIPYKAIRHSSSNPEASSLTFSQSQELLRREENKMRQ